MSSNRGSFILLLAIALAPAAATADEASVAMADFLARRQATQQLVHDGFAQMPLPPAAADKAGEKPCKDGDGDGLSDCVETGTGIFRGPFDTGTSANDPDTDGDGLRDGDEVYGTGQLDLPALGVSPVHKDLLIEYDWFDDAQECGSHTHRPSAAVTMHVAQVYANAPVQNPDGTTGIRVIQDWGQGGARTGGNRIDAVNAVLPGTFDATYQEIKRKHFRPERAGYFHYVLLAHRYANGSASSGYAEIVGDDAIVTLYCFVNNDTYVANTIVHEVGHNLGLLHGGFESCNGKPNYSSLMNYRYQFSGVDALCNGSGTSTAADFSRGDRMPLDERAVDERLGVCGSPAIDWNGNGMMEPLITYDLNPSYNAECGSNLRVLDDFDDWQNLDLVGVVDGAYSLRAVQSEVACGGAPAPVDAGARRAR